MAVIRGICPRGVDVLGGKSRVTDRSSRLSAISESVKDVRAMCRVQSKRHSTRRTGPIAYPGRHYSRLLARRGRTVLRGADAAMGNYGGKMGATIHEDARRRTN